MAMSSRSASLSWALFLLAAGSWAQAPPRLPAGPAAAARPSTPGDGPAGGVRTTVWGGRELTYEVVDGWAVHGGDIVLGRVEEVEGGMAGPGLRRDIDAINPDPLWMLRGLWPGGVIPYQIIGDTTPEDLRDVREGIAEWNARTAITFVPRTDEAEYALLQRPEYCPLSCCSGVGSGSPTVVQTVGCRDQRNRPRTRPRDRPSPRAPAR